MKIIERIPAHYEDQEVKDVGRVFRWCPEHVVLECGVCGTRMTCKRSNILTSVLTCECGASSTASVREELLTEKLAEDERLHPWRYWHSEEDAGIPV